VALLSAAPNGSRCSAAPARGKSTLAAALSYKLALPYVATDRIFWTENWRPTPSAEARAWLADVVSDERWVTDGNFDTDRDLLWDRAELIVWLDLPLSVVLGQVLRRNLAWWLRRTPVWGGQRMTLSKALGGRAARAPLAWPEARDLSRLARGLRFEAGRETADQGRVGELARRLQPERLIA